MQNAIVHHLLTDVQPVTEQRLTPPCQLPPVHMLHMMFYGMEYPLEPFELAFLTVLPPSFFVHVLTSRAWEIEMCLT